MSVVNFTRSVHWRKNESLDWPRVQQLGCLKISFLAPILSFNWIGLWRHWHLYIFVFCWCSLVEIRLWFIHRSSALEQLVLSQSNSVLVCSSANHSPSVLFTLIFDRHRQQSVVGPDRSYGSSCSCSNRKTGTCVYFFSHRILSYFWMRLIGKPRVTMCIIFNSQIVRQNVRSPKFP